MKHRTTLSVGLPPELAARMKASAERNRRSRSAEIAFRLEHAFDGSLPEENRRLRQIISMMWEASGQNEQVPPDAPMEVLEQLPGDLRFLIRQLRVA